MILGRRQLYPVPSCLTCLIEAPCVGSQVLQATPLCIKRDGLVMLQCASCPHAGMDWSDQSDHCSLRQQPCNVDIREKQNTLQHDCVTAVALFPGHSQLWRTSMHVPQQPLVSCIFIFVACNPSPPGLPSRISSRSNHHQKMGSTKSGSTFSSLVIHELRK